MTHSTSIRAAVALLTLTLSATSAPADFGGDRDSQCVVHWQRQSFAPDELPQDLPERVRSVVTRWSPLGRKLGLRMDFSSDGRVLTLSAARFNRSVKREGGQISKALACFDQVAPPLKDKADEQTVVLLRMRDRAEYRSALTWLTEQHPYLGPWSGSAESLSGFVLREPACAAWIERNDAAEEWQPENEMVNRLANCLTFVRFGEQPHWLSQGMAWHVELEVCKSIYSFPHRNGFVGVGEHKGWERALKKAYGKREDLELECADFAAWQRGDWNDTQAGMSWGLVGFLSEYRSDVLSPILRDLGSYHSMHGRVVYGDGSWELIPGYEVPATVQASIFNRHGDHELFAEATRYFQKGSRFRPRPMAK